MKTSFTNKMCAHVWAQLSQPHGHSGSMRFDGAVGYSYAEPVAHIVQNQRGERVALFTSTRWSNTTDRHVYYYRNALPGRVMYFSVPDILLGRFEIDDADPFFKGAHEANVAHLRQVYDDEVIRLLNVKAESWLIDDDRDVAARLAVRSTKITVYCDLFGLAAPTIDTAADNARIAARRDRLLNDPKRVEARAKREAKRLADLAIQQAKQFALQEGARADFRAGKTYLYRTLRDEKSGALLRVRGDHVQTSLGAIVPVADAKRVIALIRACKAHGEKFEPNDRAAYQVGPFKVDVVEANGDIRAGCHFIQFAEIDAVGKELGV